MLPPAPLPLPLLGITGNGGGTDPTGGITACCCCCCRGVVNGLALNDEVMEPARLAFSFPAMLPLPLQPIRESLSMEVLRRTAPPSDARLLLLLFNEAFAAAALEVAVARAAFAAAAATPRTGVCCCVMLGFCFAMDVFYAIPQLLMLMGIILMFILAWCDYCHTCF